MEPGTDNSVAADLGVPPALALSITTGQSGVIFGGDCLLYGWSLRNTSTTATAQIDIYDGADATGQLVATITLAANESTRDYAAGIAITCQRGVYVNAVSGSVAGVLWVATL